MKYIVFLCLFIFFSYGKEDFYYGFINPDNTQVSQREIEAISKGVNTLEYIRKLKQQGKVKEAYEKIKNFRDKNTITLLQTDIDILYSQIALKQKSKDVFFNAAGELENAINNSQIREEQLSKAYGLLVDLKLKLNEVEQAKYFANIIINNFDDDLTKAYGQIQLAKIYKFEYNYDKAELLLYKILTQTKNILVATIVADELFDVYIAHNKYDEARELIKKVLDNNIEYYTTNSYLALKKVDKLVDAKMPEFAVEILTQLIKRTKDTNSIETFMFKLANTYMSMYDRTPKYLLKALRLYEKLLSKYPNAIYAREAKIFIDEILMRQNKIRPSVVLRKYENVEFMEEKVLLQELLNEEKNKKYKLIFQKKEIYEKIPNSIVKRFGYKNINIIFDNVKLDMIKQYLKEDKCSLLKDLLKDSKKEVLQKLIEDINIKDKFFRCMIEEPYDKAYFLAKEAFNSSRDPQIYLYLEQIAYKLKLFNEAISFSKKLEMLNDDNILKKEFLYRFLILNELNRPLLMKSFYNYAQKNQDYINANENNPVIIDFYYQYYLYLLDSKEKNKAFVILQKLYKKQNDMKARIYSPFVEQELARYEKEENNIEKQIDYLLKALTLNRKIKPNEQVKIFYEILKAYETLGNNVKKQEYVKKCKEVKNTKDSLYKKMCDEM